MAQSPGEFQRRKESLTQSKAKAILKRMKDLNINIVVLYWDMPPLPLRTLLFRPGLKHEGSNALVLPGKVRPLIFAPISLESSHIRTRKGCSQISRAVTYL